MAEESGLGAKLVAEAVGTFVLIFTIGCNVLSHTAVWAPVSIASSLMVMIYAFAGISGANFNPAVSFALGLSKTLGANGMDWAMVGMYAGVQTAGGIAAGIAYRVLFHASIPLSPATGYGFLGAGMAEFFYTFMLVFVVLNVAVAKKEANHWFGLAIGFVIIAGAYGAGAISGGCFNPAVAIALDVTSFSHGVGWCLIYTIFELAAAAAAVLLFKVVRPKDFSEDSEASMAPMVVSEFLGTFMLVLTVGLNVLGGSPAAAFSIAAALMCMIYALGDVSGAHFNPAVTLAIFASGLAPMEPKEVGIRMATQVFGGISAAVSYATMYGNGFPLMPGKGHTIADAITAEVIFTAILCIVVLACACSEKTKASQMFGLAIGSCITVGGFAIGSISGGSLNPAVSWAIALSSPQNMIRHSLLNGLLYTLAEFGGALLAAGIVWVTHEVPPAKEDSAA